MIKYVYVFVRKDIPLADQMVQVGHVCLVAGKHFKHPVGTHLVLLEVKDERELFDVATYLVSTGIRAQAFFEPDDDMGPTSIATEAIDEKYKRLFKHYKLWRAP